MITGTVTSAAAGHPVLASICVQAIPVARGLAPLLTTSGVHGRYRLAGMLPGSYRVEFSANCGTSGYATTWWHDATSAATATIVHVPAGVTRSALNATLPKS
jgi:hypothetical protein